MPVPLPQLAAIVAPADGPEKGSTTRRAGAYDACMTAPPPDLDTTRRVIAARELVATASAYLTADVAMTLPFEALSPFKALIKRFFSTEPWTEAHAAELSAIVRLHVTEGWWQHDLGGGIVLEHGVRDDRYVLWVSGATSGAPSIFERVFEGPVVPEATPHPRKVKFSVGGTPAPGTWYRRNDPGSPNDRRVERLFAEPDVTDVMVAGDFVTVGIGVRSSWELRLEPLLALVTELFSDPTAVRNAPERTREELIQEAGRAHPHGRPEELHLLDPDDPRDQARLRTALEAEDPRVRRVAVAVLLESSDPDVRTGAAQRGIGDESRLVRRTAVDAAADTGQESFRSLLERVLTDDDPWIRWKAVRSLGELGIDPSRDVVTARADDPDFQVRFEVARVLRSAG